jgi:predicted P-loop ATPase
MLTWRERLVIILLDARPNDSVRAARRALGRELRGRGADVRHAHLPDDDHRVNGPDDLVGVHGDTALWRVIDTATVEEFHRNAKNQIIGDNLDNLRLALVRLGLSLTHNEFSHAVYLNDNPLDDTALDRLIVTIDDHFHFRAPRQTLSTLLVADAHRSPVHPVRSYLDRLVWDGTPRLDTWLVTYAGADDTAYVRSVGALPILAAVRRIRQPGCKFDELLVLETFEQGTLKSSALRALCPDDSWFTDDLPLGVDSKQVIERTSGKWIIEAAEMHGHRGREAEQLKAFLSRQIDGPVRLAYGRLPTSVPRQFIMIGTTNATAGYLKDWTGGRRFWPVRVRRFDLVALERDRDQLWAEAAAREADGESIRLDPSLWAEAAVEQEARRAADPWEEVLAPLFEGDGVVIIDKVPVNVIWKTLGLEANCRDNHHADRVTAIAQRYGFQAKKKCRYHGEPADCWVRSERSEQEDSENVEMF